ncbi:SprT family zinc-dependent metalloprotease [Variovorax sp. J22G21]|uniref:M48 family metallopeptidase n=1 Tax=Variovorax fucosicus TaxID=3053517 RepID=UPI0025761B4D|nr:MULTISPECIES: SprT family zinc-dependent metalloprotease [unclassified Variovorax]MDM0042455.1 SprT family zinc-dependent metalloprotease [Variovorax sp. J22R193]MDM0061060.1 SprT family zinc-dependent metalloprotease [Variovorax sp. J22G21]
MRGLLQFTLDLFDGLSADAPETPVPSSEKFKPDRPSAPVLPADPALSLTDALTPARFAHPRASREVQLGNARVAYEFTRGQRRTIGFVVGAEGLSVRAPRWVALRDVDAALQEKSGWILRKLAEADQRHARLEATRIEWRDGVSFPFLGEPVVVRLDPKHGFKGVGAVLETTDPDAPRVLRMALANNATPAQIRDAAQAWLTRQARRIFIERLDHFAPQLGVRWNKLSLSNASTRWGSASADGAIRLHWRLIHFRMPVIDYVVAHELSHLRVMDHSARFWETVESVVPDYGTLRKQLKDESIPRWS